MEGVERYKVRLLMHNPAWAAEFHRVRETIRRAWGENVLAVCLPGDYKGCMLFVFENGKVAKVDLSTYETKSNRRKLTGAYCDKSPVKGIFCLSLEQEDRQFAVYATDGRCLIFSAAQLQVKTTRSTLGVAVMALKKNKVVDRVLPLEETSVQTPARYRAKTLPAAGAILKEEDSEEKQQMLF